MVCVSVPDECELKGNPPTLQSLSKGYDGPMTNKPLGSQKPPLGADLFLILISITVTLSKYSGASVLFAYTALAWQTGNAGFIVPALLSAVIVVLIEDLIWAAIMGFLCNSSNVSRVEYNSWTYVFVQRARFLIGHQITFSIWGFTGFKRIILSLAGMNLGHNNEVAGPTLPNIQIPFNMLTLKESATLTSGVWVGEERWENGVWIVDPIVISEHCFIGDTGSLVSGTLPNNSVIGSMAVVYDCPKEESSVCVGNPATSATYMSEKEQTASVQKSYFSTSIFRYISDIVCLILGDTLMDSRQLFLLILFAISEHTLVDSIVYSIIGKVLVLVLGFILAVLVKKYVIGKFESESANNMYSFWFYRRNFYFQVLGIWCQNEFSFWFGSEISNIFFRLLGAAIGERAIVETPAMSLLEVDLIKVCNDCVV